MQKVYTQRDYLNIGDIAELNGQMRAVDRLWAEVSGQAAGVIDIDTSLGVSTMAVPAMFNRIERNIDVLAAAVAVGQRLQPTRTWLGEGRDAPLLSFRDVNRWFDSIRLLRVAILSHGFGDRVTGTYAAGNCATRQMIRRIG